MRRRRNIFDRAGRLPDENDMTPPGGERIEDYVARRRASKRAAGRARALAAMDEREADPVEGWRGDPSWRATPITVSATLLAVLEAIARGIHYEPLGLMKWRELLPGLQDDETVAIVAQLEEGSISFDDAVRAAMKLHVDRGGSENEVRRWWRPL